MFFIGNQGFVITGVVYVVKFLSTVAWNMNTISGASTQNFKYFKAGVVNLLLLTYPQINIEPLCIPPNKNRPPSRTPKHPLVYLLWAYFEWFKIMHTPCELLACPQGYAYPRLRIPALRHQIQLKLLNVITGMISIGLRDQLNKSTLKLNRYGIDLDTSKDWNPVDSNTLRLGFSTFCYSRTPKSILSHFAYPQIKIDPLHVPPNTLLFTFCGLILNDLKFCEPPANCLPTHRGTHNPGWESLL